jgi:hypothetical protein
MKVARRCVKENPREEKAQEGIGRHVTLTGGVFATDRREEQSPEGGHGDLARPGNREQEPRANDKRATAGDELVRLLDGENP